MKVSIKLLLKSVSLVFFLSVFVFSCKHDKGSDNKKTLLPPKEPDAVLLKNLKVNGKSIEIKDKIDLGKMSVEKIKLEWEIQPDDATVTFNPELEEKQQNKGIWNIASNLGKKTISITVKKDKNERVYTLSLEKLNMLKIARISCDDEEKNENIFSNIDFKNVKKSFVILKVEPSDKDATVEFSGFGERVDSTTWKWLLSNGDNSLKIKLKKGNDQTEYTASVKSKLISIAVVAYLNGTKIHQLPNDFELEALSGANPTFDAKCNSLLLQLETLYDVKKVIFSIDGKEEEFPLPHSPSGKGFRVSEKLCMLEEEEKEFDMFIIPDDSRTYRNACKHLKFKAKGNKGKVKIAPSLSINGNFELPKDLLDNLEKSENEAYIYKMFKGPANIAISVSSYEKEKLIKEVKIDSTVVPFPKYKKTIEHEVQIEQSQPKRVKIEFIPYNDETTETLIWNFALQEGGEKPAILGITLESINDVGSINGELPESLTSHLKDNTNPLYKYDGDNATLIFYVEDMSLVHDAVFKLDGNEVKTIQADPDKESFFYTYNINDLQEHNVEITFHTAIPADYADLTMKFRLQRTGEKIKLPESKFPLTINDVSYLSMPTKVREHLTDGSAPLYEIDGFSVIPNITCFYEDIVEMVKHVRFTFEKEDAKEVEFQKIEVGSSPTWQASMPSSIKEAKKPYLLKIELIPKDENLYKPLIYSLKMQSSGNAVDMPLTVVINRGIKKDGEELKLDGESTDVLVQSDNDIMESVMMEVKGVDKNPISCNIVALKTPTGIPFWQASRIISLIKRNEAPECILVITVTPKDRRTYDKTICTYKITGKKASKDNAKFVKANKRPSIFANVTYKKGAEGELLDDYGATSVTFTAVYTESSKATVRYAVIDTKGEMINFPTGTTPPEKYKVMQNNNGIHKALPIILFTDKPTTIKVWVVAEDGSATDDKDGVYRMRLNPIYMRWSYKKQETTAKFEDFETQDYDEIELERSKIEDGHIYIAVRGWDDNNGGFKIKDTAGQGNFVKLTQTAQEKKAFKQTYMLKFDVSKLKDKTENALVFKCNFWDKALTKDCFTYVVKITAKD